MSFVQLLAAHISWGIACTVYVKLQVLYLDSRLSPSYMIASSATL